MFELAKLPDQSVHCIVTSPPYWGLRSYLPSGHEHKHLELGSEKVPDCLGWATSRECGECFVCHVRQWARELKRVLRDDGCFWLDLGDTYAGGGRGGNPPDSPHQKQQTNGGSSTIKGTTVRAAGISDGQPIGIPWRVALALQADGWILRSEIIWAKPSPMPESVNGWRWTRHRIRVAAQGAVMNHQRSRQGGNPAPPHPDNGIIREAARWRDCPGCPECSPNDGLVLRRGQWRPTRAHEQIFLFTKTNRYFCDRDAVAEDAIQAGRERNDQYGGQKFGECIRHSDGGQCKAGPASRNPRSVWSTMGLDEGDVDPELQALIWGFLLDREHAKAEAKGNPKSVWTLPPTPYPGHHFATFPKALPERCILASTSSKGVCPKCGAQWARVIETRPPEGSWHDHSNDAERGAGQKSRGGVALSGKTLGFRATCACDAGEPVAATVLDCFAGSGTTGEVAAKLGRKCILIELNPKYAALIRERCGLLLRA